MGHFGRLPFWSSSVLVVFHFGRLPFFVVFYFVCLPFWSSSIVVIIHFCLLPFWSKLFLHHTLIPRTALMYSHFRAMLVKRRVRSLHRTPVLFTVMLTFSCLRVKSF